jgi:hypothetical protein
MASQGRPIKIAVGSKHARAVVHRKAEAKWVKRNLERHRSAARDYYRKNRARILAQKKNARTSSHRSALATKRGQFGGSTQTLGRPRES